MTNPPPDWVDQVVERRLTEMSDAEVAALIAKARPSAPPSGSQQPTSLNEQIAAAEQAGDFKTSFALKSAELTRQINEQNRAGR